MTALEIILHIGAHRTGTSSLQHWMAANAVPLAAAGTVVWGPARTRGGLFEGLVKHPARVTPEVARAAGRAAAAITAELDGLAATGVTRLIVSEENMLGSIRNNLAEARLYPDATPRLARIAAAFGGRVSRVALAVRGYDDWWSSVLAFAVGRGSSVPAPEALSSLARQREGWPEVARAVQQAFPAAPLTVWPFEAFGGAAPRQFRALTGGVPLPHGLSPGLPPRNVAPDRSTLRRRLTRRGETEAAAAIGAGEGRWMPFSEPDRRALGRKYAEDLDWFRSGALAGMTFTEEVATESAGGTLRGVAENEEGQGDDGQIRGLG